MKQLRPGWLPILFLAATVTVLLTGQVMSQMISAHDKPAACHPHGAAPVPQPPSYRCCQSGHGSAILQMPLAFQLASAAAPRLKETSQVSATGFQQYRSSFPLSFADPPNHIPLRV